MVRRTQMQNQMNISSTKANKLLKKAKKMNNRTFNEGGLDMKLNKNVEGMADGGLKEIPEDNKGLPKLPKEVRNKMGFMKDGGLMVQDGDSEGVRGTGAMIKGTTFRGVF